MPCRCPIAVDGFRGDGDRFAMRFRCRRSCRREPSVSSNHMVLALKLILTPLLVATASLVQRRWGGSIGGLVAGLPLTSAPVSAFLAVEHGRMFAARAASGTLLGLTAMSAFCAAYARVATRASWITAAAVGLLACAATTLIAACLPQHLLLAALITFPALVAFIPLIGRSVGGRPQRRAPWWDIPGRMVLATSIVFVITCTASLLGSKWSGLLSTLPVYALVMGVFSHRHGGPAAAHSFLRGVAVGALGAAAFLLLVGALVEQTSLGVTYVVASLASISVAALSQVIMNALDRTMSAN